MTNLDDSGRLPVAVIGCGRMGKLHTRVYAQMPRVRLVGVHDADRNLAASVAAEHGCRAMGIEELLGQVKAVTIAVPTVLHTQLAEPFLRRRIPCLIEKPLAKDVVECQRIVDWAEQFGVMVQVGHIERFNPALRALDALKISPRFIEVSRISPLSYRSIDVGVVLDLMIHDIDIVLKLASSPVQSCQAMGASVTGASGGGAGVEDICNARLTFANGCLANLTASRLALRPERRMRVFSRDAYVSIDYQKRTGIMVRRDGNLATIRDAVTRVRAGQVRDLAQVDYTKLVNVEQLPVSNTDPLRSQAESFVDAVLAGKPPEVAAAAGLAAVALARRIVEAMATEAL